MVPGFEMPVEVTVGSDAAMCLQPTEAWQTVKVGPEGAAGLAVDPDYYVEAREVG